MAAPMRPRLQSVLATPAKRYKHITTNTRAKQQRTKWATAKCVTSPPDGPDGKRPFNNLEPLRLKNLFTKLPAYEKWFDRQPGLLELSHNGLLGMSIKKARKQAILESQEAKTKFEGVTNLNHEYLDQFADAIVPLERTETSPLGDVTKFERFNAPLSLLFEHMKTWRENQKSNNTLYLAQHAIGDLPKELQDDLPVPAVLERMGKGDIYGSSLWMGVAPTFTPLHRDPNPNLFVQLAGKKTLRVMSPEMGQRLYDSVMARLGKSGGAAHMRGDEMMQGEMFASMESAVWEDYWDHPGRNLGYEITVKKGGGLYIPKGWWHAVRGVGLGPNVSVNWWFR